MTTSVRDNYRINARSLLASALWPSSAHFRLRPLGSGEARRSLAKAAGRVRSARLRVKTTAAHRLALLFTAASLLLACNRVGDTPGPITHRFHGATMGTTYEIKVVAPSLPEPRRGNLDRRLASELEAINQKMSHYLPSSEVSEFNRFEGTSPFPLTPETTEVLAHALEVSALAGGAFDVTVAPLVNAWGFGPGPPPPAPPSAETIAPLRAQVGYERLVLDTRTRTVRKQVPSLTLDLSAIAKGYAVDRVAKVLQDEGFRDFMVEVGGEVRTSGDNEEGEPWRIAIERPLTETRAVQRVIALSGKSLATSGDYRNYLEWDDRRFAHIIDPRTGRPVEHRLASVSVVDLLCVRADSWATALMVLGPEEGHRVAVGQGLAALFVARGAETGDTFEERATPAWEDLLIAGAGRTMSEEPR